MENKSLEELEHKNSILELQLLRIEKEIEKWKLEVRSDTGLLDKEPNKIYVGDWVELLSKSSKKSPFHNQLTAVVVGTVHSGRRIKIGVFSDNKMITDMISTNLKVIKDGIQQQESDKETQRV